MQNLYKHLLILLALVLLISFSNTFAQQSSYNKAIEDSLMLDQVHYDLVKKLNETKQNGELKNHVIIHQDLVDGQWQNSETDYEIYQENLLVKRYNYPGWYYTYEYDLQGSVIRREIINREYTMYSYDGNGNLAEALTYWVTGNPYTKISYEYDENNFLISTLTEQWYNEYWNISSQSLYTNNENGQMLEVISQNLYSDGWRNSSKSTYTYDSNQFLEKMIRHRWSNDAWVNFYQYLYSNNQDGLVNEIIWQYWEGETWIMNSRETYVYNGNEVRIETNYFYWQADQWQQNSREQTTILEGSIIGLVLPRDGAEYTHYAAVQVQWIANGLDAVNIEFSSDNGNSWINIASSVPDTGNYDYNWSIPFDDEFTYCKIRVSDASNPSINSEMEGTFSIIGKGGAKGDAWAISVNNIHLPYNRKGIIANVNYGSYGSSGKFPGPNGKGFLFSSGFFLSGYRNGELFSNAVASASLVEDYLQGTVADGASDSRAQIYVVSVEDQPFGVAWQKWADAVELGADFYDGDGDGVYNPIDKNGNGIWDFDEDRPDLIGDETGWTVFHDGVGSSSRRWNTVNPIGIEVRQSIFGFASTAAIGNTVFVRYRFKYVGLDYADDPNELTDVYFGVWADPDIGETSSAVSDDLVGSDVQRNAGYAYNDGEDDDWGSNPPCFMVDFLSGPVVYEPGVTFEDANGNGEYDEGETSLDTAFSIRGQFKGVMEFPGARNLGISSFVHYMQSHPNIGDPNNKGEARNYMLGLDKVGNALEPCNWAYGVVIGEDCSEVDNRFWYSGDPVTQTGWINSYPTDQRQMQNTGPFTLKKGEEKEIMIAYVVGQGTDAINSITEARLIDDEAQLLFDNNFDEITDVNTNNGELKNTFKLFQNYPNPFNPTTKIKYEIPKSNLVQIVVYDILGRKVAILVNEQKLAGSYEVNFNASQLSTGVYFYELRAGNFRDVKKLVLLK